MFVSSEPVPVSVPDDPGNVIYIRPKMDFGTKQRVQAALLRVTAQDAAEATTTPLDVAAGNIALLVYNIVRWEGPAFAGVPCTPANIERLDSDEPLVDAVLAELNRRNQSREDRDPKLPPASATAGSPSSTVDAGAGSAPGISTSPAPNATTGRPRRSTPVTPTT
jgi:hypothetical protein